MEQMNGPGNSNASGMNLFQPGDVTAENVMSELNLFRTTSCLPGWDNQSTSNLHHSHTIATTSSSSEHTSDSSGRNSSDQAGTSGLADASSEENGLPYQLTPPTSNLESGSSTKSLADEGQEDNESTGPARKKRNPIPDSKKDGKYWERRRKNNMAAKRSREQRKKKMEGELMSAKEAILENAKLKQEIEVLKSEINSLRRLLRDANMTLSLWIRAKQVSEPNAQLPPMLRSPNVSFVNFPVSTTI